MRILHVIPSIAPRYGGPSQAVLGMGAALAARGEEVLIATTDADGPGRLAVPLGRVVPYEGVPTIFFRRQWTEALKYSRPLARWLGRHVGRFDVVHIHAVFSHAPLAAAAACRRQGVPYVARPLGTLDPWSLAQKPLRKRLLWRLGAERMMRGAAAIHYATPEEQRGAEGALGLGRGVVVPNGIDPALVEEPADPPRPRVPGLGHAPYVLFLGRLHQKKGLELLIEAFAEVVRGPGLGAWRLVIAGDGDPGYVATLKERAAGSPVVFAGWLGGEAKRATLRGAALMALPSRQENFGLALVESMACGIPVLVSPHVALASHIRAAGAGWVAPLEPAAFARILAEALEDGVARAARGAAGRALVRERYTWPAVAAALSGLYRDVAQGRGGGTGMMGTAPGRAAPPGRGAGA